MKNGKSCPKCGSEKIIKAPGEFCGPNGAVRISMGLFAGAVADCFVCCACGYTELWMPGEKLEDIEWEYRGHAGQ